MYKQNETDQQAEKHPTKLQQLRSKVTQWASAENNRVTKDLQDTGQSYA